MSTHSTYGGAIDPRAVIGYPPESRLWTPDMPMFPPEIDYTARIEAFATIDAGTKEATFIGANSWVFKHAHVGHDAHIGRNVEIGTGAIIGGHVVIEDDVRVGIGAVVLPHRRICTEAHIGAGAVVTKDVGPHQTVVGNPARVLDVSRRDLAPHTDRTGRYRWAT